MAVKKEKEKPVKKPAAKRSTPRKKSNVQSIKVPRGEMSQSAMISQNPNAVQRVLMANKISDNILYQIPEAGEDLVIRYVRLQAKPLDETFLDVPDFEDVQCTDLPWVGYATFNSAHRKFRNSTGLLAAVHVVREFDGYLYELTSAMIPDGPDQLHIVSDVVMPTLCVHDEIRIEAIDPAVGREMVEFKDAPILPPSLDKELLTLGYTHCADKNEYEAEGHPNAGIRYKLWGVLKRS